MKCERCGQGTTGFGIHDYCRSCSKNLCEKCMIAGCCGLVPAASGNDEDHHEPEIDEDKA